MLHIEFGFKNLPFKGMEANTVQNMRYHCFLDTSETLYSVLSDIILCQKLFPCNQNRTHNSVPY